MKTYMEFSRTRARSSKVSLTDAWHEPSHQQCPFAAMLLNTAICPAINAMLTTVYRNRTCTAKLVDIKTSRQERTNVEQTVYARNSIHSSKSAERYTHRTIWHHISNSKCRTFSTCVAARLITPSCRLWLKGRWRSRRNQWLRVFLLWRLKDLLRFYHKTADIHREVCA